MRRLLMRVAGVALLALTWSGCTQVMHYRTETFRSDGSAEARVELQVKDCFSGPKNEALPERSTLRRCEDTSDPTLGKHAIQHRYYQYEQETGAALATADYHLTFVEFDDQGWFADRKQMEALFALLGRLEQDHKAPTGETGHVLLILYAHGWKHNASQCDDNVICFARLLERMDVLERNFSRKLPEAKADRHPRRVVGVYVGWRGLSVDAGPLTNATFWTRKNTAERVGRGGVKELLTRLNDYRRARNPEREDPKTQLVIAGHSFGGLVIYSALSHALTERAAKASRVGDAKDCDRADEHKPYADGLTCYKLAHSFGDFIVLVNPAFEGSFYEPLFHVATHRCYSAQQRPVMMTVTSVGDDATRRAFPFGRWFSTRLERPVSSEQADSIRTAVGHDARYETHRLEWTGGDVAARGGHSDDKKCGCDHLTATKDFDWASFADNVRTTLAKSGPTIEARDEGGRRIYEGYGSGVRLVGDPKYSANYPYLVVKADPEVIRNHNDIYNEPFIKFIHAFFLIHVALDRRFQADGCWKDGDVKGCRVGGPVPCEVSCRLPDGRPCSAHTTNDLSPPR